MHILTTTRPTSKHFWAAVDPFQNQLPCWQFHYLPDIQNAQNFGGAFDGVRVTSDADGGL